MHALNMKLTTVVAAVLVLTGLLLAYNQAYFATLLVSEWQADEQLRLKAESDRLDESHRLSMAAVAINQSLVNDMIERRTGLAEAIEQFIAANASRTGYFDTIQFYFPAPTVQESVARNLLFRIEVPNRRDTSSYTEALAQLKDEYERLFGRPYQRTLPTAPAAVGHGGPAGVVPYPHRRLASE